MDLTPMVIPNFKFSFRKLLSKLSVSRSIETWENHVWRTFNNRLAFAVNRKVTIFAIHCSKLLTGCNYVHFFTVSYENCALTWRYKNETILCVIDVDVCCDIENKEKTVFAAVDIKLLFLYGVYLFDSKLTFLVEESVVVGIVFLFNLFGGENVWIFRFLNFGLLCKLFYFFLDFELLLLYLFLYFHFVIFLRPTLILNFLLNIFFLLVYFVILRHRFFFLLHILPILREHFSITSYFMSKDFTFNFLKLLIVSILRRLE